MCNIYKIEFPVENGLLKTTMIYDFRITEKNVVIIEADNDVNPTNYTEIIYNKLSLKSGTKVILDLSNLYGNNKESLYEWKFIIINEELEDEEFVPITKINWNLPDYKECNAVFKKYFLKKNTKELAI